MYIDDTYGTFCDSNKLEIAHMPINGGGKSYIYHDFIFTIK